MITNKRLGLLRDLGYDDDVANNKFIRELAEELHTLRQNRTKDAVDMLFPTLLEAAKRIEALESEGEKWRAKCEELEARLLAMGAHF